MHLYKKHAGYRCIYVRLIDSDIRYKIFKHCAVKFCKGEGLSFRSMRTSKDEMLDLTSLKGKVIERDLVQYLI